MARVLWTLWPQLKTTVQQERVISLDFSAAFEACVYKYISFILIININRWQPLYFSIIFYF